MDDRGPAAPEEGEVPRSSLRRPSRGPWVALVIAVIVAAGVAYWRFRPVAAPPQPAPEPVASATPAPETPSGPDLGPADQRALLESMSADPLVRKGVEEQDPIRRWAVVTDNVAEGVSPRKQLQFLAPGKPFSVETRGGRTVISEASYARYDAVANAVASISASAAANAYRQLHGMIERAYRALGYPNASLDQVTGRALQRLVAAKIPDGDVEVVDQGGGVYTYADPKLEALGPVEKHLLRMGPRNARIVQAKAREIWAELRLAPAR